jgi:hypothetical protein
MHASLRGCITNVMDNAATIATQSHWKSSRMGLVSMRCCPWMNQLLLYHLLEKFFVVRTHVIGLGKTVDKLLTQR